MKLTYGRVLRNRAISRTSKYFVFFFLLLLVFGQGGGVCLSAESSHIKKYHLKVLLLPYLSFAPFYIAEEEGFFSEQGLDIEFIRAKRSSQLIPVLAQGSIDVLAGSSSFSLFNAMARGAPIRIVADKGYLSPAGCADIAIMASKSWVKTKKVKHITADQLRGIRIAINPVSSQGYFAEKFLQTAGLTLADVQVINLPEPVKPEAFASGRIDLAYANEPWVTRISEEGHAVPWVIVSQLVPDFQNAFVFYGPTLLHQNLEAGKRFMVAYSKAVQKYNEGKTDRNIAILAKYTHLNRDLLSKACWPTFHSNGHINAQSLVEFQEWGRKKGFLDATVTEAQFWDSTFVDYANKILKGTAN
jgi:NitT/TauT family transport system substrate-binding protein